MATLPQLLSQPQPVAMPQFILTSGQLVQGIQGAQLLIPTSQGRLLTSHIRTFFPKYRLLYSLHFGIFNSKKRNLYRFRGQSTKL